MQKLYIQSREMQMNCTENKKENSHVIFIASTTPKIEVESVFFNLHFLENVYSESQRRYILKVSQKTKMMKACYNFID